MPVSRKVAVAGTIGAMPAGGVFGYALLAPGVGGAAQTTVGGSGSTAPAPDGHGDGTFHSNEDPAHEKSESAPREADENAGRTHNGGHRDGTFHSNEDPAHEKAESAAREQEETAGRNPVAP